MLDAPGTLEEHEIMRSITVTRNPTTSPEILALLSAGDAGMSVPLRVGNRYLIEFDYAAQVLHGIDPDFGFRLSAMTMVVPEPSGLLVLSVGAGISVIRWRSKRTLA
jgi:hypothetical protein